ncbi:dynactin subunit 1-like isoform X2 [Tubulanus polymorphus]|uniref:dynactin subunit 1-like isoform X2 n=1 Tax=Tubulanus polymorphus TaxID=672921 RepID=UPI003DA5E5D9
MSEKPLKTGTRVEVAGKGVVGTVAYVGTTQFSSGKWIGVVLDEAKGKNNGTVQSKKYFNCDDNHGIFVRQSQLIILSEPSSDAGATPARTNLPVLRTPAPVSGDPEQQRKKQNRLSGIRPPSGVKKKESKWDRKFRSTESLSSNSSKDVSPSPRSHSPSPATADTNKSEPIEEKPPEKREILKSEKRQSAEIKERRLSVDVSKEKRMSLAQAAAADVSVMNIADQSQTLQHIQEIDNLRSEVKDLEEKLETIKVKRAEDKTKIKEYEKTKIQLQQLQEYKQKMQESQREIQHQLQLAKKETKDVTDAFDRYKEDMSDLSETVEMATLDKEMAEEKCETLQMELETLKEKNEELTLDLEIIKQEISDAGSDGAATNYQVKQLEQQNERLKDALVKMRDLSNQEKQEALRMNKLIEKSAADISSLTKDKEKSAGEIKELQNQMVELKEQVDAALGAEEMVEQLSDKIFKFEERIAELEEEKSDLEALCDMNEELQENTHETELELREELDLASMKVSESHRKVEGMQETLADYENTITKFRDLVAKLQDDNRVLRANSQVDIPKGETPTIEIFDFKAKFAETKASAKAIDMELRKLDVDQANQHVQFLSSFMPDSFMRRGSDHDAILLLLLIPRLICKAEVLANQLREKFEIPDELTRDDVVKSNRAEQFCFSRNLIYMLRILQSILHQYESALNSCSVEQFLKIGTLLPELAIHEKPLDFLIDLLRKDQLDETQSLDQLDKSIQYFQHLYSVHLVNERVDCTSMMSDHVKVTQAACDSIHLDITRLKLLLTEGQEMTDMAILLKDLDKMNGEIRTSVRKIKRRLPSSAQDQSTQPLSFSKDVRNTLEQCMKNVSRVVQTLQFIGDGSMQLAVTLQDGEGLMANKLESMAFVATNKIYERENTGPYECVRNSYKQTVDIFLNIAAAMENGEYDFDGTRDKKPAAPVMSRAMTIKSEMSEAENVRFKFESKEDDLKELRKQLKMKQEELSEMQVRLGLTEKKLENSTRDADERVDKVQRRLDEALQQLKKKEKEFEETMDALQADIDALEHEKSELKDRLKTLSKKSLLEGLSRQGGITTAVSGSGSPSSPGSSYPPSLSVRGESPVLIQQIESLRQALKHVKNENLRFQAKQIKCEMEKLPKLNVPKKPTGMQHTTGLVKIGEGIEDENLKTEINKLTHKSSALLTQLHTMSCCPMVVDITKRKPAEHPVIEKVNPANQLIEHTAKLRDMQKQATELQVQVTCLMAANRTGGRVKTDFSLFPTPAFAKVLHERSGEMRRVGRIQIPSKQHSETIPVHIHPDQLKHIHARFIR